MQHNNPKPYMGVVMDPIDTLNPKKDTSIALIEEAQQRGWICHYLNVTDLFLKYGVAWGTSQSIELSLHKTEWYALGEKVDHPLDHFDVLLMRKDPPVNMEYHYVTAILEQAEANGTLVVNKPQALRDVNEKLFIHWFPQCIAPTLVSASASQIREFIKEHQTVVLKPLDGMGGQGIFKGEVSDPNLNVIIESMTACGKRFIMVQRFIEAIHEGDKRIFLIDGEPVPYALARVPPVGEFRGNLAAGGVGHGVKLSDRDYWICSEVGATLKEKGLLFVGLDVIGEYLTEINITSPTCVRELQAECGINIAAEVLECIAARFEG